VSQRSRALVATCTVGIHIRIYFGQFGPREVQAIKYFELYEPVPITQIDDVCILCIALC